ncbi:GH25 family lysozyme M1 1, partial [Sporomusaceae bacterium BoRhaA]|uniref:GH25 family lysozyme n=1 Tax=Pelorhabdus rhamnosifermentans TaxID=2772457 RepID=UPI001C062A2F
DVSENNGTVDWQAVKDAGIEFAMIRSSYGLHSKDERFLENVNGAHAVGLKVGAWHYSYGLSVEDAIQEARSCREAIDAAGVNLELPVFYDMEDADGYKASHGMPDNQTITDMCRAFLDNLGLDCGLYASYSWLSNVVDWQSLGCAVWNAQWGDSDDIRGYMWQYADHEIIGGEIFDGDILY